jgi:hypothetical protein
MFRITMYCLMALASFLLYELLTNGIQPSMILDGYSMASCGSELYDSIQNVCYEWHDLNPFGRYEI